MSSFRFPALLPVFRHKKRYKKRRRIFPATILPFSTPIFWLISVYRLFTCINFVCIANPYPRFSCFWFLVLSAVVFRPRPFAVRCVPCVRRMGSSVGADSVCEENGIHSRGWGPPQTTACGIQHASLARTSPTWVDWGAAGSYRPATPVPFVSMFQTGLRMP